MIQRQVQTEEDEDHSRHRGIDAAELAHGAVYPITGTRVPQNSTAVRKYKCLQRRCGKELDTLSKLQSLRTAGAEQSQQKRCDSDPRKKIEIRQREDEDLQGRRK